MKIRKIKWKNHNVIGNLELDLTSPTTGEAFENIVFAGENGTGKTSILDTLSNFLNLGTFEHFEYVEYSVGSQVFTAIHTTDGTTHQNFFDVKDNSGTVRKIRTDRSNNPQLIESDTNDLRNYGCVFSKARADYKTQQITSTTTKQLDTEKYDIDQQDDFTSLKQLLVDIKNQDESDYMKLNETLGANPKPVAEFHPTSKTFRFKNAFDNFFEKIKYNGVADSLDEKKILFLKNGITIPIDSLSTGEKQIVFRGCYLLKNNQKLSGAAILIDEPELSMHPKWQKKILNYYKALFKQGANQIAQIFIATHSEYVVEEALSNKATDLVIVLNEVAGTINVKKIIAPSVLPSITSAETNYLAFDIVSNDYHIELYGHLQQKYSLNTVKLCDNYIKGHSLHNSTVHYKASSNPHGTTYDTLSTFIRNAIDHPDPSRTFTENDLRASTELLIELCR
jgi:predicted ATP-binding protein involved in virulence